MNLAQHMIEHAALGVTPGGAAPALAVPGLFVKSSPLSPAFAKTAAGALSVKAGTVISVADQVLRIDADTPVIMPALTAGTDYAIYVCADGTIRADANWSAPIGYTTANSRKIGGFHYGLVAPGTTVAGGQFATTGNGMIWTQADVDLIAGINAWSIWDLNYRPNCPDPRGMARTVGGAWVDIYFCSTDVDVNGTSRYNTNVASGTVQPKKPLAFGGDGAVTYPNLTWWVANELAHAAGKRLLWEHEFVDAAYGVTEGVCVGGTPVTPPATMREPRFTSRYGLEQATGHGGVWGMDSGQVGESFSWMFVTGGRGGMFSTPHRRVRLGGEKTSSSESGSRSSSWVRSPDASDSTTYVRAACDHLQLD
jgi:hypothetical protein